REDEKALVRARDWTGLVARGGHHFNIIKIAAAVGESHLHVGAHMRGMDWDELKKTLPHRIELMPEDRDRTCRASEPGLPEHKSPRDGTRWPPSSAASASPTRLPWATSTTRACGTVSTRSGGRGTTAPAPSRTGSKAWTLRG